MTQRGCIPHGSRSTLVDTVSGPFACLVSGWSVPVPVGNVARVVFDDTAVADGDTVAVIVAHTAVAAAVGSDDGCWRCQTRLTSANELGTTLMERRSESRIEFAKKEWLRCC